MELGIRNTCRRESPKNQGVGGQYYSVLGFRQDLRVDRADGGVLEFICTVYHLDLS